MSVDPELDSLLALPPAERVEGLAALSEALVEAGEPNGMGEAERRQLVTALVDAIAGGHGSSRQRVRFGESLAMLGDPRLVQPTEPAYWAPVRVEGEVVQIGRHLVTNAAFRGFVAAGGYTEAALREAHWTDEGRAWLEGGATTWPELAEAADARTLVWANQPVVGVTWHEAVAYASWAGGRLPRFDERLRATRGDAKRPYPWGSPFGEGNANTKEEVLGRPVAVGLFVHDRTPEGVCDLAGNVAEWCADGVGADRWVHPGAWDQPSMAAWAKARVLEEPASRSAALGFRLARDEALEAD